MDKLHTPPPVAVVTGAGSGIGAAVSRALLAAGFRVALAGRRIGPLRDVAAGHRNARTVSTDVTEADEVEELFASTIAAWGRIDVLFNNAGILGPSARVDDISVSDWDETVATNINGAFNCAAAAFRAMKAQSPEGGRIINNGSVAAQRPRPRSLAYTVTKHAITGMTKSIALDGRAFGISCGQIDIGNVATELLDGLAVDAGALQADGTRRVEPTFAAEDAAKVVLMMAQLPPAATIGFVTVTASGMPFDGRG